MDMGTIIAPVAEALAEVSTSEPIQCEMLWNYFPPIMPGEQCEQPADLRVLTACAGACSSTEHWCADCYAQEMEDEACGDEYDDMVCNGCGRRSWIVVAEPIR